MSNKMKSLIFTLLLCFVIGGLAQTTICPSDCKCYLSTKRGRNVVECNEGGMVGALLLTNVSTNIEVLKISAPEDNMNELSMNPVIGNFVNLEEIHITQSSIPNLGNYFFYKLKKLEILNLSQNNITQPLPENFRGLNHLKELNLDDNRIYSLPSEAFRYLPNLHTLSIQQNRIEHILTGVFRNLTKLRVLRLNGNYIQEFNPEVFKDIMELHVLECRGCSLVMINPEVHKLLQHLTHLDLGENHLKQIDSKDFIDLPRLRVLKLDGNQLSVIPSEILSNHTDLKRLTFAKNKIVKIETDAFRNLRNLSELDLGYNKIERLNRNVFKPMLKSLERLVLSGNRLELDDVKNALEYSSLKDLQLADAGIADISESFIPATVTVLNLGGNQLSTLPAHVLPRDLKDLDLSRNMFRGLEGDVVEKIVSVRCKLDNNPWSCDLCNIISMLDSVNRSAAIFNVRCALPYHHVNKILGNLQKEQLSWCSAAVYSSEGANFFLSRDDGRLGIIAAGASVLLLLLTAMAVLAALCYSRRHAANYYTHEEKRDEREAIFETQSPLFGEELSFKFPLETIDKKISIATIDEIKREHAVTNGT